MMYGFDPNASLELGLYTLGDHLPDPHTKKQVSAETRIQEIIQLAVKAEEVGMDFFGVGESHQAYFVSQAHTVILGAIAQATEDIKIASSSTIISTSDPVRVYEDFSTIDLLSGGRAEIIAGRASRTGLFDLLGYNLEDYEELYIEKLNLLKQINQDPLVTWGGKFRESLDNAAILPRPTKDKIPLWRAVGGSPSSAEKAGREGMPMFMAHLNGPVQTFQHTVEAYREAASLHGHDPRKLPIATAGFLYIAQDAKKGVQEAYPYINEGMIKTNGTGFPKRGFSHAISPKSVANIGSPKEIVDRILYQYESFGMQRYAAEIDFGGLPFEKQLETLEIIGSDILPEVKKYTTEKGN